MTLLGTLSFNVNSAKHEETIVLMKLITEKAVISCDHKTGIVTHNASQSVVFINGSKVLVGNDPGAKPIVGCINVSPTTKPCTMTLVVEQGTSNLVYIDDHPVCLETVEGGTDGTPPGITRYKVRAPGQEFVETEE